MEVIWQALYECALSPMEKIFMETFTKRSDGVLGVSVVHSQDMVCNRGRTVNYGRLASRRSAVMDP